MFVDWTAISLVWNIQKWYTNVCLFVIQQKVVRIKIVFSVSIIFDFAHLRESERERNVTKTMFILVFSAPFYVPVPGSTVAR